MKLSLFLALLLNILCVQNSFGQTFRIHRPVKDNIQANGSYLYGEPNIKDPNYAHLGLDYSISYDTVFSATDGLVYFVGYNPNDTIGGYEPNGGGNYVIIQSQLNGKQFYFLYMHLKRPLVAQNQSVLRGQPIAISGNTGYSTGPHLHFEIRAGSPSYSSPRSRRNPELWCAIKGMGAIYGRIPNAANSTRVDITPDPKPRPPYTTFSYALTYNFNDPYIGNDEVYQENYAIGDVKPGTYTITALNGLYRRVVTVLPNQIVNADQATLVEESLIAENELTLSQNFPNPFNSSTVIKVYIPEKLYQPNLKLEVFDVLGRKIFESDELKNGFNEIYFDLNQLNLSLSNSILFYRINLSSFAQVKKMIYLK
jgi:hypothetical protein